MKYLIAALSLTMGTSAFANTPQLQKCVGAYAKASVKEYNLPNEALLSTAPEAKASSVDVIGRMQTQARVQQAAKALNQADAVGLVVQYSDEVHLIYVGVSFKGGQCQVQYAGDLNTANMNGSDTGLKPQNAPQFFLNYTKSQLEQLLPDSTIGDIYDSVVETLGY